MYIQREIELNLSRLSEVIIHPLGHQSRVFHINELKLDVHMNLLFAVSLEHELKGLNVGADCMSRPQDMQYKHVY